MSENKKGEYLTLSDITKKAYRNRAYSYRFSLMDRLLPEDLLLVKCAKTRVIMEDFEQLLDDKLDWSYIVSKSIYNGLAPLLYFNLRKVKNGLIPTKSMEVLRKAHFNAFRHHLQALQESKIILKRLSEVKIKIILLKGIALAETIYPDIGLRPFSDIDFIIPKNNLGEVLAILSQLGYRSVYNYIRDNCTIYNHGQELAFELKYLKDGFLPVDVHWHLAGLPYSKYMSVKQLWKRAITVSIDDLDAMILSPEDKLIYLCLHLSIHNYSRLIWFVDISELIHFYDESLNWVVFLERTKLYKLYPFTRYVLHIVKTLFGSPVPEFVLHQLNSYKANNIETRFFEVLANPNVPNIKRVMEDFLMPDSIISRFRYLIDGFFPDRDYILRVYSGKNVYIAYFLRLSNVIWKLVKESFRVLKSRISIFMVLT